MPQVETMPQSIVDVKTIVLKPQLDHDSVLLIGEKIKSSLFARFGFKPNPDDIRLLGSEEYFEPYFIIGGTYVLDYCKKHFFEVDIDKKTTRLFIAGQEFKSKQLDPKAKRRVIQMMGEEHAHLEREAYFILDRMKREVSPGKLSIAPFSVQKGNSESNSFFKSMQISDEEQIEFLKTKIAVRPVDVAEVIREVFDITERTIAYYPMYQVTYENSKNQTDATVTINGITGEIVLNGVKRLATKTIMDFPNGPETQPVKIRSPEDTRKRSVVGISHDNQTEDAEGTMFRTLQSKISAEVPAGDEGTWANIGDISIPSGMTISEDIVVKGNLTIGDNCKITGKLKALKDINVGVDTIIDGDLVSGGNVAIGPRSLITGMLKAAGTIKMSWHAAVEDEPRLPLDRKTPSDFQMEVVEVEELPKES